MCATTKVPKFVTHLTKSRNTLCKYIYLLSRSQACLGHPSRIYISKAYLYIKDRYSNNTLLARLQLNVLIWLVIKIQIYRKVLGIYIQ